jgi:hypothetical protein
MTTDDNYMVFGLLLDNGRVSPVGWRYGDFSNRDVRYMTKKFKHDPDVVDGRTWRWHVLYDSISDMQKSLPRI